jgi:hypothetical protein
MLEPGGVLMFLLRVQMVCGVDRYEGLYRTHPLAYHCPCVPRPSHTGNGKTNMNDLALYVWHKGPDGRAVGRPGEWIGRPLRYERKNGDNYGR